MKKITPFLVTLTILSLKSYSQKSFGDLIDSLKRINIETNISNNLLTGRGFNKFIQNQVINYLSGSSEISLSKAYTTYTSESDKVTFGFNIPKTSSSSGRLISLFNPLLETNIKDNFATLYKKGKWQADIRVGFKFSYLLPRSTINYNGLKTDSLENCHQCKMIIKRSEVIKGLIEKIEKEKADFDSANKYLDTSIISKIRQLDSMHNDLLGRKIRTKKIEDSITLLEKMKEIVAKLNRKEHSDYAKKLKQYKDDLATAEASYLKNKNTYIWSQTLWFSIWGFYPLTQKDYYISPSEAVSFAAEKFYPWEINAQFNYVLEGRLGSAYGALGFKTFQNNTAMADLMTSVDYNQYLQFPGVDTLNEAILETNKAFIGNYKEFSTSQVNLQLVLMLSNKSNAGEEKFLTFGISGRFEKNMGDFSAVNWRLGFPLRFRGKNSPISIEPQIRWNNTNNYADKVDFNVEPIVGINVGLPFTALFK